MIKDQVEDILYSEKEKHKGVYKHPRILGHKQETKSKNPGSRRVGTEITAKDIENY